MYIYSIFIYAYALISDETKTNSIGIGSKFTKFQDSFPAQGFLSSIPVGFYEKKWLYNSLQ